jgi:hypothetical protein
VNRPRHKPGPTLIFLHIPRTGGGTVVKRTSCAFIHARQTGPNYDVKFKEATAFLEGKARVIGSHFPFGAHELLKGAYEYATVLRDPVARAGSMVGWNSVKSSHRALHKEVAAKGVHGVLEAPVGQNLATKILSGLGIGYEGVLTVGHYDQAVKNLAKIKFVGFTESLDPWLDELCEHLGMPGDKRRERVHLTGGGNIQFSAADLKAIRDANAWDCMLYEFAKVARG